MLGITEHDFYSMTPREAYERLLAAHYARAARLNEDAIFTSYALAAAGAKGSIKSIHRSLLQAVNADWIHAGRRREYDRPAYERLKKRFGAKI